MIRAAARLLVCAAFAVITTILLVGSEAAWLYALN